jgi:hypothetical protein
MHPKRANAFTQVPLKFAMAICFFMYVPVSHSTGQERIHVTSGIGFPDLLHVGMLYQHRQTQFGITIGGWYYSDELLGNFFVGSFSGDFFYHFAGITEFSERRPWYVRSGLDYFIASPEDRHLFLNNRIGRDFYSSGKFGLTLSIGFFIRLYSNDENTGDQHGDNQLFIFPSGGLSIFYRIGPKLKN